MTGTDKAVTVTNDAVLGYLPQSYAIPGLTTAQLYHIRVSAVNSEGAGPVSSVTTGIPKGIPNSITDLSVSIALHVDEIQSVTTAATHVDEVQTITTSAVTVREVQSVRTFSSTVGVTLTGQFYLTIDGVDTQVK